MARAESGVDIELQRWLCIRLDFLGTLLTLAVAMLTIGTRFRISPAQTGVTLSYIVSIQQVGRISLRTKPLPSGRVCVILVLFLDGPAACRGRERHEFRRAYRLLRL